MEPERAWGKANWRDHKRLFSDPGTDPLGLKRVTLENSNLEDVPCNPESLPDFIPSFSCHALLLFMSNVVH